MKTDIESKLDNIALDAKQSGNYDYLADNYLEPKVALALVAILSYDLKQGGFPQYIYNSRGIYLEETLQILDKINATVIYSYLNEVINLCLKENNEYQEFINSNFEESEFKNKLWRISIDYYQENTNLLSEINNFVSYNLNFNENNS